VRHRTFISINLSKSFPSHYSRKLATELASVSNSKHVLTVEPRDTRPSS